MRDQAPAPGGIASQESPTYSPAVARSLEDAADVLEDWLLIQAVTEESA